MLRPLYPSPDTEGFESHNIVGSGIGSIRQEVISTSVEIS